MGNIMSWSKLVNQLIKDFRLSTPEIENLTGVSDAILSHLRNGKTTRPYPATIKKLEEGLNIIIDNSDPENITYKRITVAGFEEEVLSQYKYPLLSEIKAGIDDMMLKEHTGEFVFFSYKKINGCFALKVVGDSMNGTFNEGDIILIDIEAELTNNCLVAVRLKDGRKMLKRYRDISNGYYLLYSDNPAHPSVTVNASEIEAVYRVVMKQSVII